MSALRLEPDGAAGGGIRAGFHLGLGAFTTLRVQSGLPLFLRRHLERLAADAALIGLRLTDPVRLAAQVRAALGQSGYSDAVMRITATHDRGTAFRNRTVPLLTFFISRPRPVPRDADLLLCPLQPGAWRGHKLTAYTDSVVLAARARRHACFDAVSVDGGALLDTSIANLFIVDRDRLVTPPDDGRLLPGIARGLLLAAFGDAARQARLTVDSLNRAKAVFLTNSVRGIIPVRRVVDGSGRVVWRAGAHGADVVDSARQAFDAAVRRELDGLRSGGPQR